MFQSPAGTVGGQSGTNSRVTQIVWLTLSLEINGPSGLFQNFSGIICDFPRGSNLSDSWVINIESCWEDPQNWPKDRPKDWVIDIACTSSRMDCCWGWEDPRIFIMALPY